MEQWRGRPDGLDGSMSDDDIQTGPTETVWTSMAFRGMVPEKRYTLFLQSQCEFA